MIEFPIKIKCKKTLDIKGFGRYYVKKEIILETLLSIISIMLSVNQKDYGIPQQTKQKKMLLLSTVMKII